MKNPEEIMVICASPGHGNNLNAINVARSLNHSGISSRVYFPKTLSLKAASYLHRRISSNHDLSSDYTVSAVKKRGGIMPLLHSANVIANVLTHNPHLCRDHPERKTIFVQELSLALISYFPQLAHRLFGEISIAVSDLEGKTQGRFGIYQLAQNLNATLLYPYGPAYRKASGMGLKSAHVESFLPGYNLAHSDVLIGRTPSLKLSRKVIKTSGSGWPDAYHEALLINGGSSYHAQSLVLPDRTETYFGPLLAASEKNPALTELFAGLASRSVEHLVTYSSEMSLVLLTLAYLGERKDVELLPPRGYWEHINASGLAASVDSRTTINSLEWSPEEKSFRSRPLVPDSHIPIQDVISTTPIAAALGLI